MCHLTQTHQGQYSSVANRKLTLKIRKNEKFLGQFLNFVLTFLDMLKNPLKVSV